MIIDGWYVPDVGENKVRLLSDCVSLQHHYLMVGGIGRKISCKKSFSANPAVAGVGECLLCDSSLPIRSVKKFYYPIIDRRRAVRLWTVKFCAKQSLQSLLYHFYPSCLSRDLIIDRKIKENCEDDFSNSRLDEKSKGWSDDDFANLWPSIGHLKKSFLNEKTFESDEEIEQLIAHSSKKRFWGTFRSIDDPWKDTTEELIFN